MNYFYPEPRIKNKHYKTGVLLLNLGSPDNPDKYSVKRFLAQFLADKRIIELPRWKWLPILKGIILTTRPKKSAKNYQLIWTDKGSPLIFHSDNQAKALQKKLNIPVEIGMTYGQPDIKTAVFNLKKQGIEHIVCLPLFPQYSATAGGAALDGLWRTLLKTRYQPSISTINDYHIFPAYINAMAKHIQSYWQNHTKGELIIFSFHGIPESYHHAGDPYVNQCYSTIEKLVQCLKLHKDEYTVTFQSRFGKDKWVEPNTQYVLKKVALQGLKRIDIFCPGFSSDCLETLEEIAISGKEIFQQYGGQTYQYIPCLNDHSDWIDAMEEMIRPLLRL